MLADETKNVKSVIFPTDEIAEIHWDEPDSFVSPSKKTNVFLAAYTTAHARIKLYKILDILNKNVLYYDTDSIIYVYKPNVTPEICTGDFLGDLTNEIEDSNYITEFVSGGPKNYSYKLAFPNQANKQYICKVKGISLNFSTIQQINFHSMKDLILNDRSNTAYKVSNKHSIQRVKKTTEIVSVEITKSYNFNYDKRVIGDDFFTYPYGYDVL